MRKAYAPHLTLFREALAAIARDQPPDEAAFLAQPMAQDAILMRLQEIGENLARIRRIGEETFAVIAHDSWKKLIGLRNVISHGYHQIEMEAIWQIVSLTERRRCGGWRCIFVADPAVVHFARLDDWRFCAWKRS